MLLSYLVDSSTLGSKYWDEAQGAPFALPAKYITDDMTMIRIYKVSLAQITDQETKNAIYAGDLKITVTNNTYVAVGNAAYDAEATYYTVTNGHVEEAEVEDADDFASQKDDLKTKGTSRAKVAIGLTKTTQPAEATDVSKVPNADSGNVTNKSVNGSYDGSQIAALAYICVRIDGGSAQDTNPVNGDFEVKVEVVEHTA